MALIRRVSRLLRADLHALLDQLEEPDILLRQAVREMEEILEQEQQRLQQLIHEQESLNTRTGEIANSLAAGDSELDLCFDNGQEVLARDLIKRRLEAGSLLKSLMAKRSRLEKRRSELEAAIEQKRLRLESTRQKAELLSADAHPEPRGEHWSTVEIGIRDQEVELELLREKQKRGLS